MSNDGQYIQDIITLHRDVLQLMREEIAGLDTEALNWVHAPETSSIGVIITHATGAEAEMLRNLLHIPTNRVRDDEFLTQIHVREELEQMIASAEADWEELAPRLDESDLQAKTTRPNKPVPQSGLFWLTRNYGHLKEHLAQIQLTKQLYQMHDA